jgi:hypothetical protein
MRSMQSFPMRTVRPSKRSWYTLPCKYYIKGQPNSCCHGVYCRYAHDTLFFNRLPAEFQDLRGNTVEASGWKGVLDGHIIDVSID